MRENYVKKRKNRMIGIIIFTALLLILVASVWWYQSQAIEHAQTDAYKTLQDSAKEQVSIFDATLKGQFDVLNTAAQALSLTSDTDFKTAATNLKAPLKATNFVRIMVCGTDGIAYSSDGKSVKISDRAYFKKCMKGKNSIEHISYGRIDSNIKFIVAVPVKKDGKVIAAVMGSYKEDVFKKTVVPEVYGGAGYSFITDSLGNIVIYSNSDTSHPNALNVFASISDAKINNGQTTEDIRSDLKNSNSNVIDYQLGQDRRYAIYEPLGVNDWFIFNVVPRDTVNEQIILITRSAYIAFGLIFFITLTFVIFIIYNERKRSKNLRIANQQAQVNDERFRIALKNTSMTIWDYDLQSHDIIHTQSDSMRHGFEPIIHDAPESLIRNSFIHPDSVKEFRKMYDRLFAGEKYAEGTFRVRAADRSGWWYEHIQYTNLFDKDGKPYRAIGLGQDVTEKHKLQVAYESELQYQQTLAKEAYGIALFDVTLGKKERFECKDEEECQAVADLTMANFFSVTADSIVSGEQAKNFFSTFSYGSAVEYMANEQFEFEFECIKNNPSGTQRWMRCNIHLMNNPLNEHIMLFLCMRNIDKEKRREEELKKHAETDSLTSLLNHAATFEYMKKALDQDPDEGGIHVLFSIDLDHFKSVNDTLGHQHGDKIITTASEIIKNTFRSEDIAGRVGGDEFLVLIRNIPGLEAAKRKAFELTQALQFDYTTESKTLSISATVGAAVHINGESFEELYSRADATLYTAKGRGRHCYSMDCGDNAPGKNDVSALENQSKSTLAIHLHTLLENIDGSILLLEAGDLLKALYISPSFYSTSHLSPEQIGSDGRKLLALIHPDYRKSFEESIKQGAQKDRPVDFSYRLIDIKGESSWRHLRAVRIAYPESENPVMLAVITDITQLKKSGDLLDAIVEHSPVGIGVFETGKRFRPMLINKATLEINNLTEEEFTDKLNSDGLGMIDSSDVPRIKDELFAASCERKPVDIVYRTAAKPDGKESWVRATGIYLEGLSTKATLLLIFNKYYS